MGGSYLDKESVAYEYSTLWIGSPDDKHRLIIQNAGLADITCDTNKNQIGWGRFDYNDTPTFTIINAGNMSYDYERGKKDGSTLHSKSGVLTLEPIR